MKALTLSGYEGLASVGFDDNVAIPEPKPNDVLIQVRAASVNPADGKIAQGYARHRFELTFPHVLGRDGSGIVAKVGAEVKGFKAGDEVWGVSDQSRWGTHAEFVAIDAGTVAHKPAEMSHIDAASLGVAALSAYAGIVTVGQIKAGQRVLVHAGAGGVGSIAIQIAKHLGASVAATAGPKNLDYVRSLGADPIDYTKGKLEDAIKDVDVVFDLIGGDVRYHSFPVLKSGGAIVHISLPPMTQPPPRSDVTIKPALVKYDTALLDALSAMVKSGALKAQTQSVLPFSDAIKAYASVMTGHTRGKIVLDMSKS